MSTKPDLDPAATDKSKELPLPSWRKIGEYVAGVFKLERSVATLKEQNKKLEAEVDSLKREVDEHAGQLKTILNFIDSAINDRAAQSGERAALRVFEQLMSMRSDERPKLKKDSRNVPPQSKR